MRSVLSPGLAWVLLAVLAGCTGTPTEKAKEYDIKGKVVAIDSKKPAVTLDHEDVPGLMKGMEMEFPVANAKLLEGLKVGDEVQGRLKKAESGYLITQLEKR
jgi:Cu/Ag efflux protein CusF